jgi:D-tagatose-1,6-bisphosphate aldolase subunit GatZ/KbaZ
MYLNEIVSSQKRNEPLGIPSICSAHPWVLRTAMEMGGNVLIESTCNQVNQYGGYTGMTPADFVQFVRRIAQEKSFPFEKLILGGDHLGPSVWQGEMADLAMDKSERLIRDYIQAGFQKIHLDCSMRLADDSSGPLDVDLSARRTARLAKAAEVSRLEGFPAPLYVIGSEVPVPGGAKEHEEGVKVTRVEDAEQTIERTHEAFIKGGLESAWERVIAVVVQPGVEFGDDFVLEYDSQNADDLVRFIERQPMVYEAHSTDYQTRASLGYLVRDHFAFLKVGPALTFAFREAVFALALIENELVSETRHSHLIQILDKAMVEKPDYWQKYLHGTPEEIDYARKYGLSDRIRYYWSFPEVKAALEIMIHNLQEKPIPHGLLSKIAPKPFEGILENSKLLMPEKMITEKIKTVLQKYQTACESRQ